MLISNIRITKSVPPPGYTTPALLTLSKDTTYLCWNVGGICQRVTYLVFGLVIGMEMLFELVWALTLEIRPDVERVVYSTSSDINIDFRGLTSCFMSKRCCNYRSREVLHFECNRFRGSVHAFPKWDAVVGASRWTEPVDGGETVGCGCRRR